MLKTLFFTILSPVLLFSQEFTTEKITIFKNGTAYFQKKAECLADNGVINLEKLPLTLDKNTSTSTRDLPDRISVTTPGNKVMASRMFWEETDSAEAFLPDSTLQGIMTSNVGQKIFIKLKNKKEELEGIIVSCNLLFQDQNRNADALLLIQSDDQFHNILLTDIQTFSFPDGMLMQKVMNKKKPRMEIVLEQPRLYQEMYFTYIQKGLSWFSTYHFLLENNELANITLQVDMLNDLEDVCTKSIDLNFGVPSFFYTLNTITLQKGERKRVKLLESALGYEHLFTVNLSPNIKEEVENEEEAYGKVMHLLRFKNTTGLPLSEGTIYFAEWKNGLLSPIGQSYLDFTPEGREALIHLTITPDIEILEDDRELDRVHYAWRSWDLVTAEGSFEVTNNKKRKVLVKVSRRISGELLESSAEWTATPVFQGLQALNSRNETTWEIELEPKQSKQVTYKYKTYVK